MMSQDPVYVRRRRVAVGGVIVLVCATLFGCSRLTGSDEATTSASPSAASTSASATPTPTPTPSPTSTPIPTPAGVVAPTPSPVEPQGAEGASADTKPVRVLRLGGDGSLASKSVVASVRGQVFAQNMMYHHTVSVFGPDGALLNTIEDGVDLSTYGVEGHPGISQGAPVEMAFSPDGSTAWVSNYAMYGNGFLPEGSDNCSGPQGQSNSYVYEIDTNTYEIKNVVEVGAIPKYVAITHDGAKVLVTNWCSWDVSVIDTATATKIATIPTGGRYPRGIAISNDNATAFIAMMGSNKVIAVDIATGSVRDFAVTGSRTRHLVISPDGKTLYATDSGDNDVTAVDVGSGQILGSAQVGAEPRSMAISPDGAALYVVDYNASTMTKVRTSDMTATYTVPTDGNPIGITYEPTLKRVWVACYGGTILVYDDSKLPA
ncbi:MAG: beta-propeller fold lactonase family protein [Phycicoccus sp.]|nr:beta-propeller fold lactonase family protein [Phycicoccus sp.]